MELYFIIVLIIGVILYLLYINGYMILNAKKATMFVGVVRGNRRCKASFIACDGFMKRGVRFKENKRYYFKINPELTNGEMTVDVLDDKKNSLLHLDAQHQSATIDVDKRKRYYLVFRFRSATGKYELNWE